MATFERKSTAEHVAAVSKVTALHQLQLRSNYLCIVCIFMVSHKDPILYTLNGHIINYAHKKYGHTSGKSSASVSQQTENVNPCLTGTVATVVTTSKVQARACEA